MSTTPALAANKAVRVKTTFPANEGDNDDSQHVLFGAVQKTKCKATKKMKLSCTVYIPVSAMKDKDDFFSIDPMVGLEIGKKYYGTIFGKYRVHLQLKNGKPVLYKETDNGLEGKLSASRGTVKKKNGFTTKRKCDIFDIVRKLLIGYRIVKKQGFVKPCFLEDGVKSASDRICRSIRVGKGWFRTLR